MQDPNQFPADEARITKVQKKKKKALFHLNPNSRLLGQVHSQHKMPLPPSKSLKVSKKSKNGVPVNSRHADGSNGSNSDSRQDSSQYESEYRALRRRYLLLEEESSSLEKSLNEIETDNKNLEDEKFALLDQLVVLEGLMDPAELQASVR